MNGTSNSLNMSTKVEKYQGFAYFNGSAPIINENAGRLCLLTNEKANVDWQDVEGYNAERQQEPLLNYDDEARKLFAQLNLPDPMNEKDKTQATFSAESNMPNAVWIHPDTKA